MYKIKIAIESSDDIPVLKCCMVHGFAIPAPVSMNENDYYSIFYLLKTINLLKSILLDL